MSCVNTNKNLRHLLLAFFVLTSALASGEESLRTEVHNNSRAACWRTGEEQPKLDLLSGDEPRMCIHRKEPESDLRPVNELLKELRSIGREDRMHNS